MKEFILGQNYKYSEIPEDEDNLDEDKEAEYVRSEYGLEYLGQHAIHIRYLKGEKDVWFIYFGQLNEGIFKCVYNS
ncbi:MAG: hypothetical protein P8J32_04625 [bacterium]|nr:hypothetical protein [bacterium]